MVNMYKFLLTVLGAVAEMEQELIVKRIKKDIEKTKRYVQELENQ